MTQNYGPALGDNANRSLEKINQILFEMLGAGAAPGWASGGAGETQSTSLVKINALLNQMLLNQQSAASAPLSSFTLTNAAGMQITIGIGPDGDLWVTQQSGPNAGKVVDLTYGLWK